MDVLPELRTGIPAAELRERRGRLLERVRRDGLTGYVLFGADTIQYFTGFWFLSNERPVVYAESVDRSSAIFVPEFEVERTRAESAFARIESYPEYPGLEHPMSIFARVLAELGIRGGIGADQGAVMALLVKLIGARRCLEMGTFTGYSAMVVAQALPKADVQRFKDYGISIYHPNYEVWDKRLFEIISPGKQRYVGREEWHRRILDAAPALRRQVAVHSPQHGRRHLGRARGEIEHRLHV